MQPDFSIIIPVFNAEKHICRCVKSIQMQAHTSFEVILIDDGSTDQSGFLCEQMAQQDSRLVVVHQENAGPSAARNQGLDMARGRYISFVDSDDYVTADYLQQLYRAFQIDNRDVVFFGYEAWGEAGERRTVRIPNITDAQSDTEILTALCDQDMFGYAWIKAFRASVIGETRFPLELNLMEDEVFVCQVLAKGCSIGVLPMPLYSYATGNSTSLTGKTHENYCKVVDQAYQGWNVLLEGRAKGQSWLRKKANRCVENCMYYGFERNVAPERFFEDLKQTRFFRDSNLDCPFYDAVQNGNIRKLRWMRIKYRLKVGISGLFIK